MAGTVTNPTGSVNGKSLASLQDAMTILVGVTEPPAPGAMAQWQLVTLLSDRLGVCSRRVGGLQTYQPDEITLRLVVTGWKPYVEGADNSAPWAPPAADLPLVLPVLADHTGSDGLTGSNGVHRVAQARFVQAGKNGRAGDGTLATSGTLTITAAADADPDKGQSGSYDLVFPNGGTATGTFTAPWC